MPAGASGVDGPGGLWYFRGAMVVTVYGAGAIGGTTGAALTRPGHDLLLVDSHAPHVEAINAHGLTTEREGTLMTTPLRADMPSGLRNEIPQALLPATTHHIAHALNRTLPV